MVGKGNRRVGVQGRLWLCLRLMLVVVSSGRGVWADGAVVSKSAVPAEGTAPLEGAVASEPTDATAEERRLRDHVLELTFGSAQLFFTQSMLTPSGEIQDKVIPVTAALIMAEWLAHPRLSVVSLVALPLEAQSTVVDGEVREEYVAPSLAAGLRLSLFSFDVFRESAVELQLAAMAGRTMGSLSGDRYYPLVAGRLHFHTGSGFTLYLGNGYAFAEGTHSVLYGIGHRF